MNECCGNKLCVTLGMDEDHVPVRVDLEKITHLMIGGGDKTARDALAKSFEKELDHSYVIRVKTLQELQKTASEAEKRIQLFRSADCSDRNEYVLKTGESVKTTVCIVESCLDLAGVHEEVDACIRVLGSFGRHAGIHLVWLCETPLPNLVRSCIPGRIAFKTKDEEESMRILDVSGAEKLKDHHTFLFTADGENVKLIYA